MGEITTSQQIMDTLHKIFKLEMAGIIRYMHYSFMIMGHNRIPIQAWFRSQANEAMDHSTTIGEKITSYGGHPPVFASQIEESNTHTVDQILTESLKFEEEGLVLYKELVKQAEQEGDIALEELARGQVRAEQEHIDEVKKMLRRNQ